MSIIELLSSKSLGAKVFGYIKLSVVLLFVGILSLVGVKESANRSYPRILCYDGVVITKDGVYVYNEDVQMLIYRQVENGLNPFKSRDLIVLESTGNGEKVEYLLEGSRIDDNTKMEYLYLSTIDRSSQLILGALGGLHKNTQVVVLYVNDVRVIISTSKDWSAKKLIE